MKHEDEHALESIEGGEEIGHDNRLLVDEEETKCPGEAQEKKESDCPECPRPVEGDTSEFRELGVLTRAKLVSHLPAVML